jgi:hypothetical protein
MIQNIQGIEGDDIPFHLNLIGYSIDQLPKDVYFYPLNDHYNTHSDSWLTQATEQAAAASMVVFYDLVNTGDYEHKLFCEFVSNFNHPNKVYLTNNESKDLKLADVKIIPWDFMWNRIKAYYLEDITESLHLHHYSKGKYILPELDFERVRSKKFMSLLGREYGYRTQVYNLVKLFNGYISNRDRNEFLEQEPVVGAFSPVPNDFYLDSYLSVYVESNCLSPDLIHITEKTFEPLLKGHFILPFSNPGTIHRLTKMGFKFPAFIDYTYDYEPNPVTRFEMFRSEFVRLINLDLHTLYVDNKNILKHNQECVYSIPYDKSILEIFNV